MKSDWNYFEEHRALYLLRHKLTYAEFAYCNAILVHAAHSTGDTFVGPGKIAEDTGFSVRHIKTAAASVKRRGIVTEVERGRRNHRGVLRLTATKYSEAHFTELSADSVKPTSPNNASDSVKPVALDPADSVKCSARFGEVQRSDSVKPTSPSTTQVTTHLTNTRKARARSRPNKAPGDHAQTVSAFCDAWQSHYGPPYTFTKGKDGAHIKQLLSNAGNAAEARRIIGAYFADSDPWLKSNAHPLGALVSRVNTYRARLADPGKSDSGLDLKGRFVSPEEMIEAGAA
jgi:hypothetical protein